MSGSMKEGIRGSKQTFVGLKVIEQLRGKGRVCVGGSILEIGGKCCTLK